MNEVPEERRLFREAADLAIRLQNDPGNPVAVDMVRAWVARGPQHAAAWARVAAIHGMTGKILADQRHAKQGPSRRGLIVGGVAGLGALATGAWLAPGILLRLQADYTTAAGEIRRIELSDRSVISLGPASGVAIDYSPGRRMVELLAGMAYFEVTSDTNRPFSVRSGAVSATALGTSFDVSNDAGFISVSVGSGTVAAQTSESELSETLQAGDWITFDPSARDPTRGTREADQIAAWRSGMLVAEKESVAALVAKISRWQKSEVILADPSLGSRVVSGVFDLNDPVSALAAVVRPFGAKVRQIGPFLTVISSV